MSSQWYMCVYVCVYVSHPITTYKPRLSNVLNFKVPNLRLSTEKGKKAYTPTLSTYVGRLWIYVHT